MIALPIDDDSVRSSISSSIGKRRVRFAETASIHPIENFQDMSKEELRETWYRKGEFDDIKKSMIPLIKAMMKGQPTEETSEVTFRGLEYRTRQGALKRQHNKVISITSVLDEQDRQRCVGNFDAACIRDVYLQNSAHCLVSARQLGVEDEAAVADFMVVELYDGPIDDCFSSDSDDSTSLSDLSLHKFKGLNKLVNKLRWRQQTLYEDLADLGLPPQFQGMPQAA